MDEDSYTAKRTCPQCDAPIVVKVRQTAQSLPLDNKMTVEVKKGD